MDEMKKAFKIAKWFKPDACRKNSFEIYLIGLEYIKKPEIIKQEEVMDLDNYNGDMPW